MRFDLDFDIGTPAKGAEFDLGFEEPLEQPIETLPPELQESKIKDVWDAFHISSVDLWHKSKQFFVSALPNAVFRDVRPEDYPAYHLGKRSYAEKQAEATNIKYGQYRDKFREKYQKAHWKHQEWLEAHPELKPRPEWEGGVIENIKRNPKLLQDPAYWGYVAAESAAFTLGVMGTTVAVTAVTKNPWLGMTAGVAVATPMQVQDLYEDLMANGATEEQAARLSTMIGPLIASVEVAGDLPMLRAVSGPFRKLLTRNIQREVAKRTMASIARRGLKTFVAIEIAEILEEVTQGAIQDATVRTVNENREILASIPETVVRTAMATAPLAIIGAGAEIKHEAGVRPEVIRATAEEEIREEAPRAGGMIYTPEPVPEKAKPGPPVGEVDLSSTKDLIEGLQFSKITANRIAKAKARYVISMQYPDHPRLWDHAWVKTLDEVKDFIKKATSRVSTIGAYDRLERRGVTNMELALSKEPTPPKAEVIGRGETIKITSPTKVTSVQGKEVTLPVGEEYTMYRLSTGQIRVQDGKRVTVYEGELDKIKGTILREGEVRAGAIVPLPEEIKPKALPEKIAKIYERIEEGKVGRIVQEDTILKLIEKGQEMVAKKAFIAGKKIGIFEKKEDYKEMVARAKERVALRQEVGKLVSDINKLPTENLPLEYKDKIEEIKQPFDLKRRTGRTLARRDSMRQFVERMQEQGEEVDIPQEKLDLLEKVTLNDMTVDELRDVHDTMMRLYFQGSLKNKLLSTMQERDFNKIVNEAVIAITGTKGLTEESSIIRALRENEDLGLKTKSLAAVQNYVAMHLRPERLLNLLDGWTEGINTKVMFRPLWDSENAKLESGDLTLRRIEDIHKEVDIPNVISKKHQIGRFRGMTRDNAMFVYANSFNDANRAILYSSGVTDQDIQDITNFLSAEEKSAVETTINDYYDKEQWPALDKVYSETKGGHLGREYQYFPIMYLEDVTANKAIEQEILRRYYARRPGAPRGFTEERVSHTKGFNRFSYFDTIYKNWQNVEHFKAYAKSIRDASKFLYNPRIKWALRQTTWGKAIFRELDKWLKDISWGGDREAGSAINKLSRWVRTNYATSVLGYNIVSVSRAPVSWIQGARFVGEQWVINGTGEFLKNPMKAIRFANSKSATMKYRAFRQERELREILAGRKIAGKFGYRRLYQKVREESMRPWLVADKATVTSVWIGAYRKVMKTSKVEEVEIPFEDLERAAIEYADKAIRKTQPMGGVLHLPGVFRGPEYQKLYTVFKNQLNQNFNLIYELYADFGGQEKTGSTIGEFIAGNIMYILVPAFIIGLTQRRRLPRRPMEWVQNIVDQLTGGLFLLSHLTRSWGSTTPIDALIEDYRKAAFSKKNITKIKYSLRLIAKLTGFPYTQLERTVLGKPYGAQAKIPGGTQLDQLDMGGFELDLGMELGGFELEF